MHQKTVGVIVAICAAVLFGAAAVRAQTPQLILFNGKIFTSDDKRPHAEAVAISGERIMAVGTSAEIRRLAGARTRMIDLEGRTVVPGFNDAHGHFGPTFQGLDLSFKSEEPSWADVESAIVAAAAKAPKGQWIFGSVGAAVITDRRANRTGLDLISPDNPVLLTTYFGHGAIFNSRAMPALNISESQADPFGGYFERYESTKSLNGRMFEYAQWFYARKLVEQGSDEQLIAELKKRAARETAFGITSRQIMPGIRVDRFVRLLDEAELPVRVRAIPFSLTSAKKRDLSEIRTLSPRPANSMVTASGIKWILDGTPLERGAALSVDYNDEPGWRGRLDFSEAEIVTILRESLDFRQPVLLHCVGDRACVAVLDAMEKIAREKKVDWPAKRVRLEHAECITGAITDRAKSLGVVIVQNPTHFTDGELGRARWGSGKSPIRSYIEKGIPFALGSDGPSNPFLNIMFAVTHPDNPDQAITREQAVRAYTLGSAFAEFTERDKGSIEKGKLADLTVLSQDIFSIPADQLPATNSVLTLVGGRIVHDAHILK